MFSFKPSREFLLSHIQAVSEGVKVKSKSDRENILALREEIEKLATTHRRLSRIRIVLFILLYASVFYHYTLPALLPLVKGVLIIANVVGATILSIAVLYITWRLGQLWNRMVVIGSHLLAIYEKHNKEVYQVKKERGFSLFGIRNKNK